MQDCPRAQPLIPGREASCSRLSLSPSCCAFFSNIHRRQLKTALQSPETRPPFHLLHPQVPNSFHMRKHSVSIFALAAGWRWNREFSLQFWTICIQTQQCVRRAGFVGGAFISALHQLHRRIGYTQPLMNMKSRQRVAKPAVLQIRTHHILFLGTSLSLNKTNFSSLAEHIPKEEEMQVLINIIKCWKD